MTTRLQRESPWQPSPVRCTSTYVYGLSMHGCFQYIWLYMSLLCIWCVTTAHTHPALQWEPWARSVHMGIYVCVLCMWLYIHVFWMATLELNGKNAITWKHDGNLYLCGARIHVHTWVLSVHIRIYASVLYICAVHEYICLWFVCARVLSVHMAIYVSALCMMCKTTAHTYPALQWEPWVRSVHMGIYVSVLCMWVYIHAFCMATVELNGKNAITWKHDGNLYLCGARIHMSIHGCFLYICVYVCPFCVCGYIIMYSV